MVDLAAFYEIRAIGGPFDGCTNLAIGFEDEPPAFLWLARCRSEAVCQRAYPEGAHPHVWFWLPEREECPHDGLLYELLDANNERFEAEGVTWGGRVRYVLASVELPEVKRQ